MEKELSNSEILLIYEAKMCNPNGDPDAENRPRIDPKTNINLVSDVRLKRFFRDYLVEKFGEDYVYVTKISGESVRADTRVERLLGTLDESRVHEVLRKCLDARLFGATIPIGKGEAERGASKSFIGPVQFTWGFSLHKVELMDSSAITSIFSGREAAEKYGTMGRDWRVYYSLIGFYGVVSGRRAKGTGMTEDDLKVLDNLLWRALQVQPTTRSKIGERPHLYLRIEYKDAETVLGDLRRFVKVTPKTETVRNLEDLDLNFNGLANHIKRNLNLISKVYVITSEELTPIKDIIRGCCAEKFQALPHELTDTQLEAIVKKA
ncbi:MAG: type I-B CRISPR-associated protein Cas7/Csh2 [Candidatus Bathyarchaeota archaeon]|nr:type I-B CRISPR-associated protein Cas7/Csh2 [Candidatus Bathyarchaeota archaeon]